MARDRQPIPIHLGLNKSVEEVGLEGSAAALHDCFIDVVDNNVVLNRRPGLKAFADTGNSGASIDGLFWWEDQQKMVVICNGKGYTIDDSSGTLTTLSGTFFTAGKRVTFADFKTAIYAADGGKVKKITPTTVTEHADGDAPSAVTHVAFLDQYLLANLTGTGQCHRSDVGAPDTFSSNWFTAEAQFDALKAVKVENLEIFLFGTNTIEVWEDTGASDPMARVSGGYIPSGTIAPYSVKYCGSPVNTFCFVDRNGSLVALNGRITRDLSSALNRHLQQNGFVVADAAGDFFKKMGHSFYALHLPSQAETPVFDFDNGLFQHWSYWNTTSGDYERWRGNCVEAAPPWGKILVGDRSNGIVYELDENTYQDNGDAIRTLFRSGHIDRGDMGAIKRTNFVDFRAKKTAPGGGQTISLVVRHRDRGETTWSTERTITLSADSGKTDYRRRSTRFGRYYSRQWEIYCTDNAPVAILPPVEDYEISY